MKATRRGFCYEDKMRIVQVVRLSRGNLGILLKRKSAEGITARFAITDEGAKILRQFMGAVMAGKGKQIAEHPAVAQPQEVWIQIKP